MLLNHHQRHHHWRLHLAILEAIESRRLLSTVVVNTLADETVANSTTSLREAIQVAAAGDTVAFTPSLSGAITLGGEQLTVDKNLTINGPGSGVLSISGNNASRVLSVDFGATVTLKGLTIKQGKAQFGGGINSEGTLSLLNCVVTSNNAVGPNGTSEATNGQEAQGGGILNMGTLSIVDSVVSGNVAQGGAGAYGLVVGSGGPAFGGGIYNAGGGTTTIADSKVTNNKAIGGSGSDNGFAGSSGSVGQGGGIYSDGAEVHVTGGTFFGNSAVGGEGTSGDEDAGTGGDANGGALWVSAGDMTLSGVEINNNAARAGDGGDVLAHYVSQPGGSASGGAIYVSSPVATITRCKITNNIAAGGLKRGDAYGGGVYSASGLVVSDSSFVANRAAGSDALGLISASGGVGYGGAVMVVGPLSVAGSTFAQNSAIAGTGSNANATHGSEDPAGDGGDAIGGAIYGGPAAAAISRSTFSGNWATAGNGGLGYDAVIWPAGDGGDAKGGAIDVPVDSELTLTACTIASNTATGGLKGAWGGGAADGQSFGGGVRGDVEVTFAGTIAANNVAGNGPDVSAAGGVDSHGFNLIGKTDGSAGWIASDKKGTAASPLDPKLGPLASNGGATKTMALLAGSPAIYAGHAFGLTTDQRGTTRPRNLASVPNAPGGDGSDMGAFELQALAAQTPFKPFVIGATPLTIQVEDFDNGGEGIAYHDVDTANLGGTYRSTGVDIQPTSDIGGGVNVGWTKAGEWLEYTVTVQNGGYYTLDFRVASKGAGGTFHFEFDGADVTGPLTVPNTGGWQNWTTIKKDGAYLGAGTYVLRLRMDTNGASGWVGNFNHLKISRGIVNLVTGTAAHVRDGSYRFANYGSIQGLEVKKSTTGYNRETYLQFDTSNVATLSGAKLRLYGALMDTVSPSIQIGVFASPVVNWSESGITWANKPSTGPTAVATKTITGTTKKWYEIDLTTFLKAEKAAGRNVVTLVLRSNTFTSTLCTFAADEAVNGPLLVIQP
jgi:CSLREA domain-containing protein